MGKKSKLFFLKVAKILYLTHNLNILKIYKSLNIILRKTLNPQIQTCDICPKLQLRKHTKNYFS